MTELLDFEKALSVVTRESAWNVEYEAELQRQAQLYGDRRAKEAVDRLLTRDVEGRYFVKPYGGGHAVFSPQTHWVTFPSEAEARAVRNALNLLAQEEAK